MMHWNTLNAVLAADAPAPAHTPSGPMSLFASPLTLLVLMGVMMYFILFRPQQQQRARHEKLMKALKSGDKVVTSAGIVGIIITVKDKTISLRSADAKMEITKSSVTELLESAGQPAAS